MTKATVAVSRNLIKLRNSKNWSQDHLSELMGINIRTLQRYEAGERIPPKTVLENLTEIFNVSLNKLFELDSDLSEATVSSENSLDIGVELLSKFSKLSQRNQSLILKSIDQMILGQQSAAQKKKAN